MKLVIVINHFQPQIGYQEFFLARAWAKQGHQVTVVTSEYYFPFPHYQTAVEPILGQRRQPIGRRIERGVDTIRLPAGLVMQGLVLSLGNLGETLAQLQPDLVLLNGIFYPLAYQVAWWQRKLGFSLIFDSHASSFNTDLHSTLVKRWYMHLFKIGLPLVKKTVSAFTVVGTSERDMVCHEYGLKPNQVKIHLLGADTEIFYPDAGQRKKMRDTLGLSASQTVFIHAGKLTPEKDVEILLQAFIRLAQQHESVHLLLIGGGDPDYVQKLRQVVIGQPVEKMITWLPTQKHSQLCKYYNAADVGVWPGNLSNSIQEAMACAKPVILARNISVGQTTNHFKFGLAATQFTRRNDQELTQAMASFVSNTKKIKQSGADALALIETQLSWNRIAESYLKVYKKDQHAYVK